MTSVDLPMAGGCRCGRVRIEIGAPPLITAACHCTGCQKMSASAYSLTAVIPAEGFRVTEGEPVIGGMHGPARHLFCAYCMTWMFTRPEGMDAFVNIRATMFDDTGWFVPFIETCTAEKLPWAKTPAIASYERFPPFEEFARLIGDYSEWARRGG